MQNIERQSFGDKATPHNSAPLLINLRPERRRLDRQTGRFLLSIGFSNVPWV